jgi:hypothetical protein
MPDVITDLDCIKRDDRGIPMQLLSGKAFYVTDPKPEDIDILDIAHSLSMQCRYNGHTKGFYSVAEHSVLVANLVPPRLRLQALLHDASEAYVGDVIRPIKRLLKNRPQIDDAAFLALQSVIAEPSEDIIQGFTDYFVARSGDHLDVFDTIEAKVYAAIAQRFQLPAELDPAVHSADAIAIAIEKRDLLKPPVGEFWPNTMPAAPDYACAIGYEPSVAKQLFLQTFEMCVGDNSSLQNTWQEG